MTSQELSDYSFTAIGFAVVFFIVMAGISLLVCAS